MATAVGGPSQSRCQHNGEEEKSFGRHQAVRRILLTNFDSFQRQPVSDCLQRLEAILIKAKPFYPTYIYHSIILFLYLERG